MSNSDSSICALLLQHGASVNKVNTFGETPLHMAAGNESAPLPICELLLIHGANPEAVDHDNLMPIDLAEERGGLRQNDERDALRTILRVSPQRARWRADRIRRNEWYFIRRAERVVLHQTSRHLCDNLRSHRHVPRHDAAHASGRAAQRTKRADDQAIAARARCQRLRSVRSTVDSSASTAASNQIILPTRLP